jgi:hypothetical protein
MLKNFSWSRVLLIVQKEHFQRSLLSSATSQKPSGRFLWIRCKSLGARAKWKVNALSVMKIWKMCSRQASITMSRILGRLVTNLLGLSPSLMTLATLTTSAKEVINLAEKETAKIEFDNVIKHFDRIMFLLKHKCKGRCSLKRRLEEYCAFRLGFITGSALMMRLDSLRSYGTWLRCLRVRILKRAKEHSD